MKSMSVVGLATVLAAWTPTLAFADGFEEQSASVQRHERHVARAEVRHARACVGVARTGSWEDWFGTFEEGKEVDLTDADIAARYCWSYNGREPDQQAELARAEGALRNNACNAATACTVCRGQATSDMNACVSGTVGAVDSQLSHPFVTLYDEQGNLTVVNQGAMPQTGVVSHQPMPDSMGQTASLPPQQLPIGGQQGVDVDADGIPDSDDVDIGNDGVVDAVQSSG